MVTTEVCKYWMIGPPFRRHGRAAARTPAYSRGALNRPGFCGVYKIPGRFTKLSRRQKAVNRSHAPHMPCGERAIAMLKTWKVLAKLPCCPRRATTIVQATLVLHRVENNHYSG